MRILNESKRDDLLLPYLEILKQRGINATLGQLKSFMLRKLTDEGRIRNLSLGSNFYLAGAVRYYFNGDLTLNKDLSVFKNDPTAKDTWNEEVCTRLNVLINILRDAYIDTIGETFEQPEDFGTLSIAKLLRKYNKKINAVLTGEKEEESEESVTDNSFGNGYTYEILYSYQDARKYCDATYPGSWCITYGENHYNGYIKHLGIHYVILRKNGWENVERKKGPDWSYHKPQDEYGCSLIALLQSNTNGEPIYITSRWNHGWSSDNSHCEADHAFTKADLMQKTGITDEDLQKIFAEWKKGVSLRNRTGKEFKKEQLKVVRQLKYAQMRINGGDFSSITDTIKVYGNFSAPLSEAKINKHLLLCSTSIGAGDTYFFLMDKGKIIFDTLTAKDCTIGYSEVNENTEYNAIFDRRTSSLMKGYNNLMMLQFPTYILLYDTRRRQIIEIDGIKKFKAIPRMTEKYPNSFYEIRLSNREAALSSTSTNTPLKLPNGSCWFNQIKSSTPRLYANTMTRSNLDTHAYNGGQGGMFEILYDESSGERYFYDIAKKRFLENTPEIDGNKLTLCEYFTYQDYNSFMVQSSISDDFGWRSSYRPIILMRNGEVIEIEGHRYFKDLKSFGSGIITFIPFTEANRYETTWRLSSTLYDLQERRLLQHPVTGEALDESYSCSSYPENRILFIHKKKEDNVGWRHSPFILYDKMYREFIKNPIGVPSEYDFYLDSKGNEDGSGIVVVKTQNEDSRYSRWESDGDLSNYFLLNIPGVDNSVYINSDNPWWRGMDVLPKTEQVNVSDIENMVNEVVYRILKQIL